MTSGYIAVLDSGIGGISLLHRLVDLLPNQNFIYFGDNDNAPYGNKSERELLSLALKNVDYVKGYEVKSLVLGCNTLSANFIREITEYSSLDTFGVFPPIERAILSGGKTLLLCTAKTRERFLGINGVDVVAPTYLATDIEKNAFSLDRVNLKKNLYENSIGNFCDKKGHYDHLILGCTHYEFVKNKILDHFRPRFVTSGNDFTAKFVQNNYKNAKSSVKYLRNNVLFIGKNAQFNQKFYVSSGQWWKKS
ncbi:MAG: aspartate/glutamate racemase family protein [Clostridia bacterium]|nr:aspartate/glutamate racemase family protein [Clostridia bacterium]